MTAPAVPILPCIVAFNAEGGFEFLVVRGHACSTSIEGRLTSRVSLEGVRISSIGGGRKLRGHDALLAPGGFCFHSRTQTHMSSSWLAEAVQLGCATGTRLALDGAPILQALTQRYVCQPRVHLACLALVYNDAPTILDEVLHLCCTSADDRNILVEERVATTVLRASHIHSRAFQEVLEIRPAHPRLLGIPLEVVQEYQLFCQGCSQAGRSRHPEVCMRGRSL